MNLERWLFLGVVAWLTSTYVLMVALPSGDPKSWEQLGGGLVVTGALAQFAAGGPIALREGPTGWSVGTAVMGLGCMGFYLSRVAAWHWPAFWWVIPVAILVVVFWIERDTRRRLTIQLNAAQIFTGPRIHDLNRTVSFWTGR